MYWHIVEEVMLRPWAWGRADCCAAACEAFARVAGFDPMADLRGRYRTRDEAQALIAELGGMEGLAAHRASRAGLVEVQAAVPGALGVGFTGKADSLLFWPAPGQWVTKSRRGYAGGFKARRAWAWIR